MTKMTGDYEDRCGDYENHCGDYEDDHCGDYEDDWWLRKSL